MPVLHTTFLIDLKRRPARTEAILRRAEEIGEPLVVPMQVAIEYAAGERDVAAAFIDVSRSFTLQPCDEPIARLAAQIAQHAIKRRKFPGWADVQVAATAAHLGMLVVTRNAGDFAALGVSAWDYERDEDPPREPR